MFELAQGLRDWAIPEKNQTGGWGEGEDIEIPGLFKKQHAEFPGVNKKQIGISKGEQETFM